MEITQKKHANRIRFAFGEDRLDYGIEDSSGSRTYEDCSILIRFDDGSPQTYSAVGPSDGSTTHIFIRNYSRFVSSMLKAKRVRIAAEVYQEGSPVFEFDVSDFDEAKYKDTQK